MVPRWITFGMTVGLLAVVAAMCGCAATQEEQASATAASMQDTRAEVEKVNAQIDVTMRALNDIVQKPQANLKPQYETFTAAVEGLKNQALLVKTRAGEMKAQGAAYFEAWGKGSTSPELKASYAKIAEEWTKASDGFRPFLETLASIRSLLELDLTPQGLLNIGDLVKKTDAESQEVKGRIQTVSAELDNVAKLLAPAPAK